jgi:DNA adenine methylase
MSEIKSPLRYPGGKSRAISQIMDFLPPTFAEFREPFVGGGSVFVHLRQKYPQMPMWINDLNEDLYHFWHQTQQDAARLTKAVSAIKKETTDGKTLFYEYKEEIERSDFEKAVRFFVMNRITFSGTVDAGGYSQKAFEKRFTDSSIERVRKLASILADVQITNLDYRKVLDGGGENVFIFLDPPYYSATQSRLYGKRGSLHTNFDHVAFAEAMKECRHSYLITYDDSPTIRQLFDFAHIYEWELQYGMNNYKQEKAAKGKELFITNYPVHIAQPATQTSLFDLMAT